MVSQKLKVLLLILGPAISAGCGSRVNDENVPERVVRTEDLGGAQSQQDKLGKEREQLAKMGVPGMGAPAKGSKKPTPSRR